MSKVIITEDPVKKRLKELKVKPVLTPAEIKEAINLLMEKVGVK